VTAVLPALAGARDTPAPAAFRAVQVLEYLSSCTEPATLTEIALALGIAKSSGSNLISTLEAARMVRRAGHGWLLGYKVLELGQSLLASTSLVSEFRRITNALPTLQHDTALLAALDGMEVIYLARHDGTQPIRLASDIGRRMPASVTALGKAMLSALDADDLDARLADLTTLPRPTKRAHRTVAELRRDLTQIRSRGYAIDDEQNTIGVTCFAVPVLSSGQPVAVSTTLLTQRVRPELRERLIADLSSLARQLSNFAIG
jgi:DNA-binding IclR family transcriptional regulator